MKKIKNVKVLRLTEKNYHRLHHLGIDGFVAPYEEGFGVFLVLPFSDEEHCKKVLDDLE